MAKITARISVSGTDLDAMRDEAIDRLSELYRGPWQVEEVDLWGEEDIASKQGMLRNWQATFSCEASI